MLVLNIAKILIGTTAI